jgi:hypothetical protein
MTVAASKEVPEEHNHHYHDYNVDEFDGIRVKRGDHGQ